MSVQRSDGPGRCERLRKELGLPGRTTPQGDVARGGVQRGALEASQERDESTSGSSGRYAQAQCGLPGRRIRRVAALIVSVAVVLWLYRYYRPPLRYLIRGWLEDTTPKHSVCSHGEWNMTVLNSSLPLPRNSEDEEFRDYYRREGSALLDEEFDYCTQDDHRSLRIYNSCPGNTDTYIIGGRYDGTWLGDFHVHFRNVRGVDSYVNYGGNFRSCASTNPSSANYLTKWERLWWQNVLGSRTIVWRHYVYVCEGVELKAHVKGNMKGSLRLNFKQASVDIEPSNEANIDVSSTRIIASAPLHEGSKEFYYFVKGTQKTRTENSEVYDRFPCDY